MNKLKVGIALCALITACVQAQESDFFALVYSKADLSASIDINGYVVSPAGFAASSSGQMELNLWLMKTTNKITVKFQKALGSPETSEPKLSLKIYRAHAGQFPDDGTLLLQYEISRAKGDKISFPSEKVLDFNPDGLPALLLWERAEICQPSQADKQAMTDLLIRFNTALDIAYGDELLRLLAFRAAESARSHYLDPATGSAAAAAQLKAIMPLTKNRMEAVPLGLQFHSLAGGRLFQVTDADGGHPVRTKPDADVGQLEIGAYLAKIDGRWELAR